MFTVKDKKVLVIGLGISGMAAAHFLADRGAHVHGVDKRAGQLDAASLLHKGATIENESAPCDVASFNLVVVSPGIPQTHPLYLAAIKAGVEVIGEIELGCRFIKQPMVGITGTNGKTTVTLMIAHVLNHSGYSAKALGNVGVPLTQEIANISRNDILVAELSSYQLDTLSCRVLDAAVVLNVTPDHLDRYPDMEAYAKSKFHIKDCMKDKAPLYIEEATLKNYGHLIDGFPVKTYGYSKHCDVSPHHLNYKGKPSHDVENLMAAYAICSHFGVDLKAFLKAVESFKKPSHRIEFVRERRGVSYYDDSKGTNIDAVIRAVEQMRGSVVLIAGGVDKGFPYTSWLDAFQDKVKAVCAIGQSAKKIERELSHQIPVKIFSSLEEAIKSASDLAQSGDSVLLSPGCSSFDMFRDYAHRGEEFQRLVHLLG